MGSCFTAATRARSHARTHARVQPDAQAHRQPHTHVHTVTHTLTRSHACSHARIYTAFAHGDTRIRPHVAAHPFTRGHACCLARSLAPLRRARSAPGARPPRASASRWASSCWILPLRQRPAPQGTETPRRLYMLIRSEI